MPTRALLLLRRPTVSSASVYPTKEWSRLLCSTFRSTFQSVILHCLLLEDVFRQSMRLCSVCWSCFWIVALLQVQLQAPQPCQLVRSSTNVLLVVILALFRLCKSESSRTATVPWNHIFENKHWWRRVLVIVYTSHVGSWQCSDWSRVPQSA